MKKYKILAVLIVVVYFCQSFLLSYGGIGADSLSYFGIAADLPQLKTNLFPLGFPFLIKIYHYIFQDYFWATKFLMLTMISGILFFSWFQKFFFKETVLLFCGKTLFFVFVNIGSEGPFLFLLYFLFYFLYQIFHLKKDKFFEILMASLLIVCLFTVRYSGIYILLGLISFAGYLLIKKTEKQMLKSLILIVLLSGSGTGAYLIFNLYTYGSFTGENLRGKPAGFFAVYIFRDVMGIINSVNPFIGIKPASQSFLSLAFQFCLMVVDLFLLRYMIQLVKMKKMSINLNFHRLIWTIAGVYAMMLFLSGLFQQIEEMALRLLAATNFLFFFSFLIIYFKNLKSDKWIFRICCIFFAFLVLYNLKMPVNYLKSRAVIAKQMPKYKDKKYLINNEKGIIKSTIYIVPVINKSFSYNHTNSQAGELKQSIAGSINPEIKWLKYDTIPNKSEALYTSYLFLKE